MPKHQWSIVAGQINFPSRTSSQEMHGEYIKITPSIMAEKITHFDKVNVVNWGESWWEWKAIWSNSPEFTITMSLYEEGFWCSLDFIKGADISKILCIARLVEEPGIYMHNDEAIIYSVNDFEKLFCKQ